MSGRTDACAGRPRVRVTVEVTDEMPGGRPEEGARRKVGDAHEPGDGWLLEPVDPNLTDPEVGLLAGKLSPAGTYGHVIATCVLALARDYLWESAFEVLGSALGELARTEAREGFRSSLDEVFAIGYERVWGRDPLGLDPVLMDAPLIGRADGLRCDERSGLLEARRTSLYWGMDPDDAAYRGEWTAPVPGVPGTRMDGELAHRCYLWLTKTEPARRRTRREAGKLLRDLGLPGRGHEGKPGGGMT